MKVDLNQNILKNQEARYQKPNNPIKNWTRFLNRIFNKGISNTCSCWQGCTARKKKPFTAGGSAKFYNPHGY